MALNLVSAGLAPVFPLGPPQTNLISLPFMRRKWASEFISCSGVLLACPAVSETRFTSRCSPLFWLAGWAARVTTKRSSIFGSRMGGIAS